MSSVRTHGGTLHQLGNLCTYLCCLYLHGKKVVVGFKGCELSGAFCLLSEFMQICASFCVVQ